MGFWTDLGNLAVGAIEKDRENTKEKFAIRNEELQANRASLIKRKDKRYEKDIENYEKEKEKYDTLKSAAAKFKDGTIDERTYAALYHTTTFGDKFANLPKTAKEYLIDSFDGKTADYKLTGSLDEIEKKYAIEEANINKITAEKLKDARNDSFLVKKIIGENDSAKQSLEEQVNSALKAHNTVMSEKSISGEDPTLIGIPVKVGGQSNQLMSKFLAKKNSDKYQEVWNSHRKTIDIDLNDKDSTMFLNLAKVSAGGDDLAFKYNKDDSRLVGIGQPAIANIEAMKYFFNRVKDNDDNMVYHYFNVTPLQGNIGKTWTKSKIAEKTVSLMDGRWGNINEKGLNFVTDARLTTIIPLNVLNENNQMIIDGDNALKFDKRQMKSLSDDMNKYIVQKAKAYRKVDGNLDEQGAVQKAYLNLYNGQNINEFRGWLSENSNSDRIKEAFAPLKNKQETSETDNKLSSVDKPSSVAQTTETTETTTQPNNRVITSKGIKQGNKILTWEKIEQQVNSGKAKLTTAEQAAFEEWKLKKSGTTSKPKKGTTYEEMMKETQANNQAIIDAFNPNKNKMTQGDTSRFSFNKPNVNTNKS